MSAAPSLNTFGAILSFAIDLEARLGEYYTAAAGGTADLAEQFEEYARKSAKRGQRLTAIRQENVTEMILEPIAGLNAEDYLIDFDPDTAGGAALAEAIRLETRAERFYAEAGPKLNVTEARRAFQRLAQENAERLEALHAVAG
jgi:hypothetical protein